MSLRIFEITQLVIMLSCGTALLMSANELLSRRAMWVGTAHLMTTFGVAVCLSLNMAAGIAVTPGAIALGVLLMPPMLIIVGATYQAHRHQRHS